MLWAAVLFFLSELQELPPELRRFAGLNDKFVHVVLYATLGITLAWGRERGGLRTPHWVLLAIGYAYGALDEWHQSFVPGRTPDVADFFADVVGVTLGYFFFLWIRMRYSRTRPEPIIASEKTGEQRISRRRRTGSGR